MFTEEEKEVLRAAIEIYGPDSQKRMLLEEMAELQKEICKFWRGEDNVERIAEEVADVEIMLEQVKMIFCIEAGVEKMRDFKVKRLKLRLYLPEGRRNEHGQISYIRCPDHRIT